MSEETERLNERIDELDNQLLDAKERNDQLAIEFHSAVERYEKQIATLERGLAEMTSLAMDYKDANNQLESQIRERMSSPLND
jgi:uncharacterized coiled-coil DUF342 family protein